MSALAFLIDFGSTFTKITAVDVETAQVLGRSQAPSTVLTDVRDGLLHALGDLQGRCALFGGGRPLELGVLENHTVLASSSAAGGLRMAVIGLVPGLTVEAAKTAALGAGAKLVGSWSFKLPGQALAEIEALRPDMILLTGGTDGGDRATILHNAGLLAQAALAVPVVLAGNREVSEQATAILVRGGKEVRLAMNVMPVSGRLAVESTREEIRNLFMERITQAKGLDKLRGLVPVVLPTPMAVLQGAILGAQGTGTEAGCGDLVVIDVGGATTDVHSVGYGEPTGPHFADAALPEPFAKRTVEGDLGIRFNAATLLERVGATRFRDAFCIAFPQLAVSMEEMTHYIETISRDTSRQPTEARERAVDAQLARAAVDLALERHAGRRERIVAREGETWMHYGRDLSEMRTLIGTGGVFAYNPYAAYILSANRRGEGRPYEVLTPKRPRLLVDDRYLLYAVGLLAESHPDVALKIFKDNMRPVGSTGRRGSEN